MKEYTIRELSEMFGLPASTIRYYEDEGILTNVGRTPSGQRIFTDGHVNRLRTICCFKNTGMTIAELKQFFAYEADEPAHLDDILTLLHQRQDFGNGAACAAAGRLRPRAAKDPLLRGHSGKPASATSRCRSGRITGGGHMMNRSALAERSRAGRERKKPPF